jgi:quercetin dioxygenase-like cupin family protein
MTDFDDSHAGLPAAILTPQEQRAVWFLGSLVRVRASGNSTGHRLAVLEHRGARGYSSPLHRHDADEETFFVLAGELRVEVEGSARSAGAGAVAFLPRKLTHAFVVTSPEAHFLTLHTPAGFDAFTVAVGSPAAFPFDQPPAATCHPTPPRWRPWPRATTSRSWVPHPHPDATDHPLKPPRQRAPPAEFHDHERLTVCPDCQPFVIKGARALW